MSTPAERKPLLIAALASVGLGVGKALLAVFTGSHVLFASAVDSLGDGLVSSANYWLGRFASEPADDGHPYGHGKVEALAGLGQALLLTGGALWIVRTAVVGLLTADRPAPVALPGIVGIVISMTVSLALGRMLRKAGDKAGSLVLRSDAVHYTMDAASGIAALVGLGVTASTGWVQADDIASLFVAALMVPAIVDLSRAVLDELVDRSLPAEDLAQIEVVLRSTPGLDGWHGLRTRRSGPHRFVEVHVELDGAITLAECHRRTEALEVALRATLPGADVLIHADVADDS